VTIPRGIARDRRAGNDHDELWRDVWGPNDRSYFERWRPDLAADVVVQGFRG
jgi:hypothetical protein